MSEQSGEVIEGVIATGTTEHVAKPRKTRTTVKSSVEEMAQQVVAHSNRCVYLEGERERMNDRVKQAYSEGNRMEAEFDGKLAMCGHFILFLVVSNLAVLALLIMTFKK